MSRQARHDNEKLIAIVGPTASGKSDLAMDLARQFKGEIICADSRTIYKGMNIGTAKPSKEDRAEIPHHLLDLLEPDQSFSAAEFKQLATQVISNIQSRGKLPILVGGSGLYIYAVIYDYQFPAGARTEKRVELEAKTTDELLLLLQHADPEILNQIDTQNRRRVIRAIETAGQLKAKSKNLDPTILLLGLALNKEVSQQRIQQRAEKMLSQGLFQEVKMFTDKYGNNTEALNIPLYRAVNKAVAENWDNEKLVNEMARQDLALVKKQMTWFKRNGDIVWTSDTKKATGLVREFLR